MGWRARRIHGSVDRFVVYGEFGGMPPLTPCKRTVISYFQPIAFTIVFRAGLFLVTTQARIFTNLVPGFGDYKKEYSNIWLLGIETRTQLRKIKLGEIGISGVIRPQT